MKNDKSKKKKFNWKKGLLSVLLGAVSLSSMFLVGCGEQGPQGPQGEQGQAGSNGATWYSGVVAPTSSVGKEGDFYFQSDTYEVFKFGEDGWSLIANLKGTPGDDGKEIVSVTKTSSNGLVDVYTILFSDNTSANFSVTNGSTGKDGSTWHYGDNEPTANIGKEGDFYFQKNCSDIWYYGNGGWEVISNIKGETGKSITKIELKETNGLNDTYTIFFSDGGSFDFTVKNGADGLSGVSGSAWHTAQGEPNSELGKDGDLYLDTKTYDLYSKTAGVWNKIGNIKGDSGSVWYSGEGEPNSELGKLGDFYLEKKTCDVYEKTSEGWKTQLNLKGSSGKGVEKVEKLESEGLVDNYKITFTDGSTFEFSVTNGKDSEVAGADGATWYAFDGEPSDTLGKDGDLYLNTSTYDLYKKGNSAWVKIGNIKGESGVTWHSGVDSPAASIGKIGDFYFETDRCVVWQYKSTGWVESVCLKGDDGKGVVSVEQTGTNGLESTYRITFTDNSYFEFKVSDGKDGSSGTPGVSGADGATWYTGETYPVAGVGKNGDLYLNTSTYDLYKKVSGAWEEIGNIKGESGSVWYSGTEAPTTTIGKTGDYYLETDRCVVWEYRSTGWVESVCLKGDDGKGIQSIDYLSSSGLSDTYKITYTDGSTTTFVITNGSAGESGSDGTNWVVGNEINGTGENIPANIDGTKIGDLYFNNISCNVYKCVDEDSWSFVTNLKGESGQQGEKGENGQSSHIYIGYDGYVWTGDERTSHKVIDIVGTNNIIDNTLELKNDYYFNNEVFDTTKYPVALMSGYEVVNEGTEAEYVRTNYSHTTINQIAFYADSDGVLEVGEVEGIHVLSGSSLDATYLGQPLDVKKGFNLIDLNLYIAFDKVFVIGGGTTNVKVCLAKGISANDDLGSFATYDENGELIYQTGDIHDKLILQVKAKEHRVSLDEFMEPSEYCHFYSCQDCLYVGDVKPHNFDECYPEAGDQCVVKDGEHNIKCSECGYVKKEKHEFSTITSLCKCGVTHECYIDVCFEYIDKTESGHGARCTVCGSNMPSEPHLWLDGKCYYCDYECIHQMSGNSCTKCGYTCEHVFDKGYCTICGAPHGCLSGDSANLEGQEYTAIDSSGHKVYCTVCDVESEEGHLWDLDYTCVLCGYKCENHNWEYGMCTICGGFHNDCSIEEATVEQSDDSFHNLNCSTCGNFITKEEHDYVDAVCTKCNWVHDCEVAGTLSYYSIGGTHLKECKFCMLSVEEQHTYDGCTCACGEEKEHNYNENWVCIDCGFEHVEHEYDYLTIDSDYCQEGCLVCGVFKEGSVKEEHSGDCGNCAKCGYQSDDEEEGHTYEYGECIFCGYTHNCQKHNDYTYSEGDAYVHNRTCNICGKLETSLEHDLVEKTAEGCVIWSECELCEYKTEPQNHKFVNSVCEKCGYECVDHEYSFGMCVICKFDHKEHSATSWSIGGEESEEGYHYKRCEVCDLDYIIEQHTSSGILQSDENGHYLVCNTCGGKYNRVSHTFGNCYVENGESFAYSTDKHFRKCSICNYVEEQLHDFSAGNTCECGMSHGCFYEWDVTYTGNNSTAVHEFKCDVCGRIADDPHYFNGDDTCDGCGYKCENTACGICNVCATTHAACTYDENSYSSVSDSQHVKTCVNCSTPAFEDHIYENGVCKFCKKEHNCTTNNDYSYTLINETSHKKICDVCGKNETISHSCESGVYHIEVSEHYQVCDDCDGVFNRGSHTSINCDICGNYHSTPSDCEFTMYMQTNFGASHMKVCVFCGEPERGIMEAHEYEAGVCTACGYEHSDHTFTDGICTVCGFEDPDKHEHEYSFFESDPVGCIAYCDCGEIAGVIKHEYEDGVCINCSYRYEDYTGVEQIDVISNVVNLQIINFSRYDIGSATLVKLPDGRDLLIDAGLDNDEAKMELEALLYEHVNDMVIEYFVISSDVPERAGGAVNIFELFEVLNFIVLPEPTFGYSNEYSNIISCAYGETDCQLLSLEEFNQIVYRFSDDRNIYYEYVIDFVCPMLASQCRTVFDNTIMVYINYGGHTILITGDVSADSIDSYDDNVSFARDIDAIVASCNEFSFDAISHAIERESTFFNKNLIEPEDLFYITTYDSEVDMSVVKEKVEGVLRLTVYDPTETLLTLSISPISING